MRIDNVTGLTTPALYYREPDEIIVIVPSTKEYAGTLLWGESGSGVQIPFHVTTANRIVFATHQVD